MVLRIPQQISRYNLPPAGLNFISCHNNQMNHFGERLLFPLVLKRGDTVGSACCSRNNHGSRIITCRNVPRTHRTRSKLHLSRRAAARTSWKTSQPSAARPLFILHSLIQVSAFSRRRRRPVLPPLSLSVGRGTSHLIADPISFRTPSTSEGQ